MKKTILFFVLALAFICSACGDDELTAKREAMVTEYNSIVAMVEENNARVNEALANGAEIPQETIDAFNAASANVNEVGDLVDTAREESTAEEIDEIMATLNNFKTQLAGEFGKLEAYLDLE